jgi:DNA-directed RNA polymerase subunit beta
VGISAALIPFLEHDDANRALMGSNMQRQAVPLLKVDPPVRRDRHGGLGRRHNTGMCVKAKRGGTVTYVDAERIIIDNSDEYELRKFVGLNERTCQNQKPIVVPGREGRGRADHRRRRRHRVRRAGHRQERARRVQHLRRVQLRGRDRHQRAAREGRRFTSIHIDSFDVEIRETKLGREEFTRDIPNVSEKMLRNLDENGIIRIGARVGPGDILVGKVSPKSKTELTPEEKLLHAIFGRAGEDVKNDSLEVPSGVEGIVIGAKKFSRRVHLTTSRRSSSRPTSRRTRPRWTRRRSSCSRRWSS